MMPVTEMEFLLTMVICVGAPMMIVLIALCLPEKKSYIGRPRIERRRR
jgi:hypothetical protein